MIIILNGMASSAVVYSMIMPKFFLAERDIKTEKGCS